MEPAVRRTMLDVTVARLDVDRVLRMGELAASAEERAQARITVIGGISHLEADGWLGTRWYRWARMFGLPRLPASPTAAARLLLAPFDVIDHVHRTLAPYFSGVLAVFDAGLALAPGVPDEPEANEVLLQGWTGACLPTSLTPGTAYGPRTPEVEEVLRHAWAASPAARLRAHEARAAIPAPRLECRLRGRRRHLERLRCAVPRPLPVRRGPIGEHRPRPGGRGLGRGRRHRVPRRPPRGRARPAVEALPRGRLTLRSHFFSRHARSNGSRHAFGAMSWWIAFGPHVPGG